MMGYYPRCSGWYRDKAPAALTLIVFNGGGMFIEPCNASVDTRRALRHKAEMTAKHIAQSGCRGPRPKE